MRWVYDDGGRSLAGYVGTAGDCVTRSIAIATGRPYAEVYVALWGELREYASTRRDRTAKRIARKGGKRGTTPRNGVSRKVFGPYLESLGWEWVPTMRIGSGCTVHLADGELPGGRLIVLVSKHLTAVIDGVIFDTFDPQREGDTFYPADGAPPKKIGGRCVYGYFRERVGSDRR